MINARIKVLFVGCQLGVGSPTAEEHELAWLVVLLWRSSRVEPALPVAWPMAGALSAVSSGAAMHEAAAELRAATMMRKNSIWQVLVVHVAIIIF